MVVVVNMKIFYDVGNPAMALSSYICVKENGNFYVSGVAWKYAKDKIIISAVCGSPAMVVVKLA